MKLKKRSTYQDSNITKWAQMISHTNKDRTLNCVQSTKLNFLCCCWFSSWKTKKKRNGYYYFNNQRLELYTLCHFLDRGVLLRTAAKSSFRTTLKSPRLTPFFLYEIEKTIHIFTKSACIHQDSNNISFQVSPNDIAYQ